MEYEIKKDKNKIESKGKDELANGKTTNSSVIQDKDKIILQKS